MGLREASKILRKKSVWVAISAFTLAVLCFSIVHAATIRLEAYISYGLQEMAPSADYLADGSVVMIIGSTDAVRDPMAAHGTNYISDSTTGDDVIIGTVFLDSLLGSGTFYDASLTFDSTDNINYMYLRFFDTTNYPVVGQYDWGMTDMSNTDHVVGGWLSMDFAPDSSYHTTSNDSFVVIPEPGSGHLLLLFVVLIGGMAAAIKREKRMVKHAAAMNKNGRSAI